MIWTRDIRDAGYQHGEKEGAGVAREGAGRHCIGVMVSTDWIDASITEASSSGGGSVAKAQGMLLQTDLDENEIVELGEPVLRLVEFLIGFAIIVIIGWFIVEPAISRVIRRHNRNNPTLEEAITRYVRLIVLGVGTFVGLSVAGFTGTLNNSALVVAAVTLALGIAGQSVIGSLVSGMALVVDPEFNVGNYIRWEGGEGEVTSITLRITRVQTPDGGLLTIPNTTLTEEAITRPFQGNNCRTVEYVTISYEDDVERALDLLAEVVDELDGVLETPAPRVGVEELGDDGVVLHAQYWIENPIPGRFSVRSNFARGVKERFERAGIEISPAAERELDGRLEIEEPRAPE